MGIRDIRDWRLGDVTNWSNRKRARANRKAARDQKKVENLRNRASFDQLLNAAHNETNLKKRQRYLEAAIQDWHQRQSVVSPPFPDNQRVSGVLENREDAQKLATAAWVALERGDQAKSEELAALAWSAAPDDLRATWEMDEYTRLANDRIALINAGAFNSPPLNRYLTRTPDNLNEIIDRVKQPEPEQPQVGHNSTQVYVEVARQEQNLTKMLISGIPSDQRKDYEERLYLAFQKSLLNGEEANADLYIQGIDRGVKLTHADGDGGKLNFTHAEHLDLLAEIIAKNKAFGTLVEKPNMFDTYIPPEGFKNDPSVRNMKARPGWDLEDLKQQRMAEIADMYGPNRALVWETGSKIKDAGNKLDKSQARRIAEIQIDAESEARGEKPDTATRSQMITERSQQLQEEPLKDYQVEAAAKAILTSMGRESVAAEEKRIAGLRKALGRIFDEETIDALTQRHQQWADLARLEAKESRDFTAPNKGVKDIVDELRRPAPQAVKDRLQSLD